MASAWEKFKAGFQSKNKRYGVGQAKPNLTKFGDTPKEIDKKKSIWEAQQKKNK